MPRVLHVTPDLTLGGGQVLVTRLSCAAGRYEPAVASLFGPMEGQLVDQLRRAGIPVLWHHKRKGPDLRAAFRLGATLRSAKADVVHTHRYALGYAAPFLGGRPSVHTTHTLAQAEIGHGRFLHRLAFARGTLPVGVSEEVSQSLRELYHRDNVETVLNGVDVASLATPAVNRAAWRASVGLPGDAVVIAVVARLDAVKNHSLLLEAFHGLPGVHLALAGDGPERDDLTARIARHALGDHIHMLGNRADVRELLHAADIVALSSKREGIPLSILEAMAVGRAVVAPAVGGLPSVLDHGRTGLLVPPGDAGALNQAFRELALDPSRRQALGEAARNEAVARFDVGQTVAAYERLYDKVRVSS